MKRSEINAIMRESLGFLKRMNFLLPPFATWTPQQWQAQGPGVPGDRRAAAGLGHHRLRQRRFRQRWPVPVHHPQRHAAQAGSTSRARSTPRRS